MHIYILFTSSVFFYSNSACCAHDSSIARIEPIRWHGIPKFPCIFVFQIRKLALCKPINVFKYKKACTTYQYCHYPKEILIIIYRFHYIIDTSGVIYNKSSSVSYTQAPIMEETSMPCSFLLSSLITSLAPSRPSP